MEKDILLDQIEFVSNNINCVKEEMKKYPADKKGYKELIDSFNSLITRYNELCDKLDNFELGDIETRTLELEHRKLELERDKFQYETTVQNWKDIADLILRGLDVAVKISVPCIAIAGSYGLAKLSFMKADELALCDGRIFTSAKDVLKIATTKL